MRCFFNLSVTVAPYTNTSIFQMNFCNWIWFCSRFSLQHEFRSDSKRNEFSIHPLGSVCTLHAAHAAHSAIENRTLTIDNVTEFSIIFHFWLWNNSRIISIYAHWTWTWKISQFCMNASESCIHCRYSVIVIHSAFFFSPLHLNDIFF